MCILLCVLCVLQCVSSVSLSCVLCSVCVCVFFGYLQCVVAMCFAVCAVCFSPYVLPIIPLLVSHVAKQNIVFDLCSA